MKQYFFAFFFAFSLLSVSHTQCMEAWQVNLVESGLDEDFPTKQGNSFQHLKNQSTFATSGPSFASLAKNTFLDPMAKSLTNEPLSPGIVVGGGMIILSYLGKHILPDKAQFSLMALGTLALFTE